MSQVTNSDQLKMFKHILDSGLQAQLNDIYESDIKPGLIKKLDEKKDEIIAGLVLHLLKDVDITTQSDAIRILIKTEPLQ